MPTPAIRAQINQRLDALYERHIPVDADRLHHYYQSGRGNYAPADAGDERDRFAICLATTDGEVYATGHHDRAFALHSISKVFAYALALADNPREEVLARVGVEPSGDSFNSITFDERHHRPHNPMVNAGALVTCDLVQGTGAAHRLDRIVALLGRCAGADVDVDEETFDAEQRSADRNRATAYLMRAEGMLDGDVEELLALYLRQCSVRVTCRQLAVMAATLANGCVNPITGERALAREHVRDVLSVMYTCGMYDAAGEWAYDIGVPAKSGVAGAILAVVPGKLGIGVYSPGLDVYGNSVRGVGVCKEISGALGLHVFATEEEDALLGRGTPADD